MYVAILSRKGQFAPQKHIRMFTPQDLDQIARRGMTRQLVDEQIQHFVNGFPFLTVIRAATVGDGIIRVPETDLTRYIRQFDEQAPDLSLLKFVPASGAATRMFKSLFAALDGKPNPETDAFFARLDDFAFYEDLKTEMARDGLSLEEALSEGHQQPVLTYLLTEKGLDYGNLPKGLLKFHNYADGPRTPLEEHLVEGAAYANSDGAVRLHVTVSPEHRSRFDALVQQELADYESWLGVSMEVTFSEQKKATDTISVNPDNTPFRNADQTLLFRPAGHGALIENLNDIAADLVFIKNIDNVVPDELKQTTITYKKVLATVLLDTQKQLFRLQERLASEVVSAGYLAEAGAFLHDTLCVEPPPGFAQLNVPEQLAYYRQKLDRPIRVCGMVPNVGEPGGGPFWAKNRDGSVSLQVVESAQIDMDDAEQRAFFEQATHFNPVDLVCSLKDRHGKRYHLPDFRDPLTGFITAKSKDGKELKAQELPGLWNGAMANWNTLFVEVPLLTFNPVKTVNDLLRPQHQPVDPLAE